MMFECLAGRTFIDPDFGTLGVDYVQIQGQAIRDVTFGQNIDPHWFCTSLEYDGSLGLGLNAFGYKDVRSIFEVAIDEYVFSSPVFTLWLQENGENGGNKGLSHLHRVIY